jgi:transposase
VKYSDKVRKEAIWMIRRGKSVTEVSKNMGISYSTIKSWMMKEGLTKKPRNIPNDEDINQTLDMLRDGHTESVISRKLDLPLSTIIEWRNDFERDGFL